MRKDKDTKGPIEDLDDLESNDIVWIQNNPKIYNVYTVRLENEIGSLKDYRQMFSLLRNASPEDSFAIYLNNGGGSVHTGIEIINAMKACKGTVYTCISGPVYSMASIIALQGEKIYVEDNTMMMFHTYSTLMGGKSNELDAEHHANMRWAKTMDHALLKPFLTDEEVTDMLNGKDIYLHAPEIRKRLKKIRKLGE